MQELAESGAKVLNAQAVEFAKDRGIAIYARATKGGAETVIRKLPPRAPGRVVGVASETGLVVVTTTPGPAGALATLLDVFERRQCGGKQLLFQDWPGLGGAASLVLSLENLHEFGPLRRDLEAALGERIQFREGVGAVSCIGAGINSTFGNLRRALGVLLADGVTVLGTSTSSFRISFLMEEAAVPNAVRRLHDELVTEGVPGLSDS